MSDLVILFLSDGNSVRCADFTDAKSKAISFLKLSPDLEVYVEETPAGGGLMTTLEFDKKTQNWVPK